MSAPRGADSARVVVYTRPGCHLCEEAEYLVGDVCTASGDSYDFIDITGDADLERRFTDEVPVIFVDGKQHDFWRVDVERLRNALHRA